VKEKILPMFTLSLIATLLASIKVIQAAETIRPEYVPNEIIVKFHKTISDTVEEQTEFSALDKGLKLSTSLDKLNTIYRAKKIKPLFKNFKRNRQHIRSLPTRDGILLTKKEKHILRRLKRAPKGVKVPDIGRIYKLEFDLERGRSLEELVVAYNNDPDVEYAELNYIVSTQDTPNDPLYPLQWALNNTGQDYPATGRYNLPPGTVDSDIDAPQAWGVSAGRNDIIVAVVDTGVDYDHPDLAANMWINETELNGIGGVDDDENGYTDDIYGYDFINQDAFPRDDYGHGTHCAGIIAAEGDNAQDIAGVCWNGNIMALKFLGSGGSGDIADALKAFYYAVENGADVVSNSWVGGEYSEAMKEVIDYAYSQGVVMVASAGNNGSTNPQYPAYYDHMLSVAATDSDDQKASFSNYGTWVDIAAPGVDILSLRASGTSLGKIYDDYTTIASGTSMSCPYVAGACAFILSIYPEITPDQLEEHLENSADPIDPVICASGRLNLYKARLRVAGPEGKVYFDSEAYCCSGLLTIRLFDSDLADNTTQAVIVSTNGGDFEIVTLTELASSIGIFVGTILTDSASPDTSDSLLQVSDGQIVTVTYNDEDDGTGAGTVVTDTAVIDCQAPVICDIRMSFPGRQPTISFETDEPTTGRVLCGLVCGGPYIIDELDFTFATSHTLELTGVTPETKYFFVIEANDIAGNKTVANKKGRCYEFTTTGVGNIYVPAQCPTIQAGIDNSWDGSIVWVADGVYTGAGNRDIDFKGMSITVRSENGPENCIVDCNDTETDFRRGFYFHSGEDNNSVLAGFTITNGYIPGRWNAGIGGGILCTNNSSPTITNCIITENSAGWEGGGILCTNNSSPTITNCIITGNSAGWDGGGILCANNSSPTITNCIITGNSARWDGGGMCNLFSSPNINNCSFIANSAIGNDGGGINNENSSPTITNCIFSGNCAYDWGGAIRNIHHCDPAIINCTIVGNLADDGGGMFYWVDCEPNIINCTFAENVARNGNALGCDSGMPPDQSNIQLTNCILWDGGDEIWNNDGSTIAITYSNIQGGFSGEGNIDIDPFFVEAGYWDANGTPEDANDDFWVEGNYHLLGDSPCINAGDPNYIVEPNETDLDGRPRVIDGRIDVGAYEYWPPVEAQLRIFPEVINRYSGQKNILAWIRLPEGITKEQIDSNEPILLYPGEIEAVNQYVIEHGRTGHKRTSVLAFFKKAELMDAVADNGQVEVEAVGSLTSGRYFYGSDTVLIQARPDRPAHRWRFN